MVYANAKKLVIGANVVCWLYVNRCLLWLDVEGADIFQNSNW